MPSASLLVFGGNNSINIHHLMDKLFKADPPKRLGLSDVVEHFLNVKMMKTERIGNWCIRPLRMERMFKKIELLIID